MKKAEGFVSISSGMKSEKWKVKTETSFSSLILHLLSVILPFVAHKACTDN
jgi:hypothetical protein